MIDVFDVETIAKATARPMLFVLIKSD